VRRFAVMLLAAAVSALAVYQLSALLLEYAAAPSEAAADLVMARLVFTVPFTILLLLTAYRAFKLAKGG